MSGDEERIAAVVAQHLYSYPDSFCACEAYIERPERDYATHVAAALVAAGIGDLAAAKAEAWEVERPSCYREHGADVYDGERPVGSIGTHAEDGRRCRWDGERWRVDAWDQTHFEALELLFKMYALPNQSHGPRGEKDGWSPDELLAEHLRDRAARIEGGDR